MQVFQNPMRDGQNENQNITEDRIIKSDLYKKFGKYSTVLIL
jgi:hypothetical protein